MATIDEKLEHFNKVALEEAAKKRDEILQQMKKEKEALINQKREEFQVQAQEFLKAELQYIEKEKNEIISKAFLEARELVSKKREEIKKSVFDEIEEKIKNFVRSDHYKEYLLNLITKSCKLTGEGELIVLLREKDINLVSEEVSKLPLKISLKAEDEVFGGCKVINKSLNTFIDNTISKKIKESMDKFFEISCLRID
jgi:V/A-type H+-transporting ATPase subunit E